LQSKRKGCVFELDRGFHKTFLGKAECRETVLGAFIESEFFVSQSSVFWLLLSQTSLFHRDDREDIEGSGTWGLIKNIKQLGCRVSSFSHLAKKKTKKKKPGWNTLRSSLSRTSASTSFGSLSWGQNSVSCSLYSPSQITVKWPEAITKSAPQCLHPILINWEWISRIGP
jgi:hypothetical protein